MVHQAARSDLHFLCSSLPSHPPHLMGEFHLNDTPYAVPPAWRPFPISSRASLVHASDLNPNITSTLGSPFWAPDRLSPLAPTEWSRPAARREAHSEGWILVLPESLLDWQTHICFFHTTYHVQNSTSCAYGYFAKVWWQGPEGFCSSRYPSLKPNHFT